MECDRYVEITPEDPTAIVNLADLKSFLGISSTDHDVLLTSLGLVASKMVEQYCNRLFVQRAVVETLITEESYRRLILEKTPIDAIGAITRDGTTVDHAALHINKSAGIIRKTDGSVFGLGTYVVTYSGGRATPPEPIVQAVKELVRDIFNSKDRPVGVTEESVPDVGSIKYADDVYTRSSNGVNVPGSAAALLSPYVLRYS